MIFYSFITFWYFILAFSGATIYTEKYWQVTSESRLEIAGETNINEFHCLSVNYLGENTLLETKNEETGQQEISGDIVMQATGFDCHNTIMTKDFAKTINANEFPEIKISFIKLQRTMPKKENQQLSGQIAITLAGKTRTYAVSCVVREESDKGKHLEGNRSFRLSDFGLKPTQKFFGAVKVKDSVSVDFHLLLKKVKT